MATVRYEEDGYYLETSEGEIGPLEQGELLDLNFAIDAQLTPSAKQ